MLSLAKSTMYVLY